VWLGTLDERAYVENTGDNIKRGFVEVLDHTGYNWLRMGPNLPAFVKKR
jgi:hypothetical protein